MSAPRSSSNDRVCSRPLDRHLLALAEIPAGDFGETTPGFLRRFGCPLHALGFEGHVAVGQPLEEQGDPWNEEAAHVERQRETQFSREANPSRRNEGALDNLRRVHQQFLPFGNDGIEANRPAQYDVLDAKPT